MLFEAQIAPPPAMGLRREMSRMFDDALSRAAAPLSPATDVREDDAAIVVTLELAGVRPENVEVTFDAGVLTVRGEKTGERKEGEEHFHMLERSYGKFTRSFRLPKGVDESKIEARFDLGVLEIRVPKAALPQPKKIQINTDSSHGSQESTQINA